MHTSPKLGHDRDTLWKVLQRNKRDSNVLDNLLPAEACNHGGSKNLSPLHAVQRATYF
jgi:hypothetical protein